MNNKNPASRQGVFPAPAGINRLISLAGNLRHRVPRASGDKPIPFTFLSACIMCSPRQRG
ncbi:hypothetical protein H5M16_004722 [Salmonella enterica]|nr:hypothetical protein [Salmonella enterica]EHA0598727.1 hypothetical protein [Salmonella enterica]EHB9739393.1 hypothetical protein [Salmonella enterica]